MNNFYDQVNRNYPSQHHWSIVMAQIQIASVRAQCAISRLNSYLKSLEAVSFFAVCVVIIIEAFFSSKWGGHGAQKRSSCQKDLTKFYDHLSNVTLISTDNWCQVQPRSTGNGEGHAIEA